LTAFSPEVEEEMRAQLAIKRYLHETHPWWTCEYTAEIRPREGRLLVHRVVLAANEKCSRSHHRERFDVLYDPKRDEIAEVRHPARPIQSMVEGNRGRPFVIPSEVEESLDISDYSAARRSARDLSTSLEMTT
jgi:hypothetical protein